MNGKLNFPNAYNKKEIAVKIAILVIYAVEKRGFLNFAKVCLTSSFVTLTLVPSVLCSALKTLFFFASLPIFLLWRTLF